MTQTLTLIGCAIFQEETEKLLAGLDSPPSVIWLPVGLHDNLETMEETLERALIEARSDGPRGLLYGYGCMPDMRAFAAARGIALLSARNCLAALTGEDKLRELEKDHTLVASLGWIRKMWLGRAGTAGGWQVEDYRQNFGRYDRVLVLDPGLTPLTDEEIITCYDLIQVPLELHPFDLGLFHQVLTELMASTGEKFRTTDA